MKPEYQKYQLIDDYLNNKLSDQETLEFEQVMKDDLEFREEVLDQKLANDIIIENRFFEVVASIEGGASIGGKAGLTSGVKTILGVTISAGIAIVAGIYFFKDSPVQEIPSKNESPVIAKNTKEAPIALQENITKSSEGSTSSAEVVESSNTEKPVVSEEIIIDNSKSDNINLGKKSPTTKKTTKKASNTEEEDGDGSYILEIPLESQNQTSYTFNPDKGESWTVPLKGEKNALLKILDKTGREVYRVKISKGLPNQWKGISSKETPLKSGHYIYLLDFGNENIEHGYISIDKEETGE